MNDRSANMVSSAPGVPVIPFFNWGGMYALYMKEVRRFFKVQLQTIWAPAITTLLFLVIFSVAMAGRNNTHLPSGVNFATFIAPGLIVMAMMQNSFANGSFSLLSGKMMGTIVDYLMPPLATGELLAALVGGAVTRAFLVGFALWVAMSLWPGVSVLPHQPLAVLWFGLMGAMMLAFLGILTSVWAEKFDHAATVQNFVVQPLSLLSGTFYSVDRLAPAFQVVSHFNPFFYVISGFRFGFLGFSDSPLLIGSLGLLGLNIVLGALCYRLLAKGWRIKA